MATPSEQRAAKVHKCTQLFDRHALSIIWANRTKLDPTQIPILTTLYDNKQQGTRQATPIIYKLASNIPGKLGYGRYYGTKGSIETLQKKIRATLCKEYYTDIDIVNCHPCLIVQIARQQFNLSMPNLEYYVTHRTTVMDECRTAYNMRSECVKTLILKILYNGILPEAVPEIFRNIQREMNALTTLFVNSGKHTELLMYCRRQKDNIYGSFTSYIVQTEERYCLDAMIQYLQQNGHSVDVLAYDGCMIRHAEVDLAAIEAYVLESTGYHISLAKKEMIPIDYEEEGYTMEYDALSDSDIAYEKMRQEWESNHFYFKPTYTIVEVDDTGAINHFSIAHASETFNSLKLGTDSHGNDIPFLKRWRNDPSRRIVDRLVYKPAAECLQNEASLFKGFTYQKITEPAYPEAVAIFENILKAVCGDDETIFIYVRNTFAHMIQKPFDKTGVCVIFSSKTQGTGKDTVMSWVSNVLGNHVAHYTDDDLFWGQYDTCKEGAVLMYLEEAGSAANKAKFNALKARITCNDFMVNPKGLKAYSVKNIARYFMTTNETCPVKFEESDRRFLIVKPSDRLAASKVGNQAFWTDVHTGINESPGWLRAVGEYLEGLDLTGWNPRIIPETEMRAFAETLVADTPERAFLVQWNGINVPASQLYSEYKGFCIQNNMRYKPSLISFGMAISDCTLIRKEKDTATRIMMFSKIGGAAETD